MMETMNKIFSNFKWTYFFDPSCMIIDKYRWNKICFGLYLKETKRQEIKRKNVLALILKYGMNYKENMKVK